jgi:hypothetical protein
MAAPAADDIQRVLFVAPKVHVYAVPPLSSTQGYKASQWNVDNERSCIFTARIRIVETATRSEDDGEDESVRTDVRLEDPKTGDLFANCPYEVLTTLSPWYALQVLIKFAVIRAPSVSSKSSIPPVSSPYESSMAHEKRY